jgi:hypothetical protein
MTKTRPTNHVIDDALMEEVLEHQIRCMPKFLRRKREELTYSATACEKYEGDPSAFAGILPEVNSLLVTAEHLREEVARKTKTPRRKLSPSMMVTYGFILLRDTARFLRQIPAACKAYDGKAPTLLTDLQRDIDKLIETAVEVRAKVEAERERRGLRARPSVRPPQQGRKLLSQVVELPTKRKGAAR